MKYIGSVFLELTHFLNSLSLSFQDQTTMVLN